MNTLIKKLCVFTVLFVLGAAWVSAEEKTVTFKAGETRGLAKSNKTADTLSLEGVTIISTIAAFALDEQYRIYGGSKTTFSVDRGTIKKVEIHCTKDKCPSWVWLSSGKYTTKNYVATWTGNIEAFTIEVNYVMWATQIDVTYDPEGSSERIKTSLEFADPANKFFPIGDKRQDFTNAATLSPAVEGAVITYSTNNTSMVIIDSKGAVQLSTAKAGTATVTAKYSGDDYYAPCTASYTIRVAAMTGDGTQDNPYTIADVLTLGADGVTGKKVYVKGVIGAVQSTADDVNQEKSCTYSIVDAAGDEQSVIVNGGKYLAQADVVSSDQLAAGDQVVLCGKLELADDQTVRLAAGNYIDHFWGNAMTLDENAASNGVDDMRHATVTLHRTFNANAWNSLVLPFDMAAGRATEVFGPDASFANFTGTTLNADGTCTLVFEATDRLSANTPVFVYGATNAVDAVIEDVHVVSGTPSVTPGDAAFAFSGSYGTMTLSANDWFISSDNNFYCAIGTEQMKATRAVFRPLQTEAGSGSLRFSVGQRPTSIGSIGVGEATLRTRTLRVYNLMGQTVDDTYHGIVIVNGKKYVNR